MENQFSNFDKKDFEEYINDIYPQVWTEEFQLALLSQNDDDLIRLFLYSFPNEFCETAKNIFFETYNLNIVEEIFAFMTLPKYCYGNKAILSKGEFDKMQTQKLKGSNIQVKLEKRGIELTIEDYYLSGGFILLREKFPEIAKKIYDGTDEGNMTHMYVININKGCMVAFYL